MGTAKAKSALENDQQFLALHVVVEDHFLARLEFVHARPEMFGAGALGDSDRAKAVGCHVKRIVEIAHSRERTLRPTMRTLVLQTERRTQLVDITAHVREALTDEAGRVAVLFIPHTTAGIVLQASGEGATAVAADVEAALERLVDESSSWKHTEEGDRNPWSHVRSALTASSVTIPLADGELALGELQTIFFCEFDGPRERKTHIAVT
jgi:secondary thiamine-phosphate synthase enzyme